VTQALERLGYTEPQVRTVREHIERHDTIERSPILKDEHLPVFDCAMRPRNGVRSIEPMGHIRMMAAVQPFISGAISKTVNMPPEATVKDIENTYIEAWRLGLKAVAIYRDGSKRFYFMNTAATETQTAPSGEHKAIGLPHSITPARRRLPDERISMTHKFEVAGHEGYLTVGYYEDGQPGEIFIKMAKEGSTISGLMDSFATAISIALQHRVPLKLLCDKFSHTRFEPSGFTGNDKIPMASSLMDYIFRYLDLKHSGKDGRSEMAEKMSCMQREMQGVADEAEHQAQEARNGNGNGNGGSHGLGKLMNVLGGESRIAQEVTAFLRETDAPPCHTCGFIMVRNGACHKCENCGATSGCS